MDYMAPGKYGPTEYERLRQMDPKSPPYQIFASAINRILTIWLENQVLSFDVADPLAYNRKFCVNLDHPAVVLLLETDFIEDA